MQTILVIDDDDNRATQSDCCWNARASAPSSRPTVKPARSGRSRQAGAHSGRSSLTRYQRRGDLQTTPQLRHPFPIVVLSAVGEEIDKVLLLEIGRRRTITSSSPLARANCSRASGRFCAARPASPKIDMASADVQVDIERRVVTRRGQEVKFTPAEYNLLTFFLPNPDRPLSRDMILNSVWGYKSSRTRVRRRACSSAA